MRLSTQSNPPDEPENERLLKLHDKAFLNAILSYGVYTSQEWTLNNSGDRERENDSDHFKNLMQQVKSSVLDLSLKKAYELYISLYNRNTFEAVSLNLAQAGEYHSHKYGYPTNFKHSKGEFETLNNLAKAGIFKTKNEDGSYNLHLSFRGTDTNAKSFKEFFSSAYLDMSAYYDCFKPLEMAILDYAKNPSNNIKEMHVSGHSLGGSMVQEFFDSPEVKASNLNIQGFTYGAPGNNKTEFYSFFPALYHVVKHQKFMEMGKSIFRLATMNLLNHKDTDLRITRYTHSGDLIPRVSSPLYEKSGTHIRIQDNAHYNYKENLILTGKRENNCLEFKENEKNFFIKVMMATQYHLIKKPLSAIKRAVTFQSHDMLRYVFNIDSTTKGIKSDMNSQTCNNFTPHISKFAEYKKRFDNTTFNPEKSALHLKAFAPNQYPHLNGGKKNGDVVLEIRKKISNAQMLKKISKDITGEALDISFVSEKSGNLIFKP